MVNGKTTQTLYGLRNKNLNAHEIMLNCKHQMSLKNYWAVLQNALKVK